MATVSVVKLKIRRGTDAQRKLITLDVGELGFVTDPGAQRIFVGDGTTKGGLSTTIKFFAGPFTGSFTSFEKAQVGDLAYNTVDTKLYVLTGYSGQFPNFSNANAYRYIGPSTDNFTLNFNSNGQLSVKSQGISAIQISDDAIDKSYALTRPNPTGKLRVNYDGASLKANSGQLYVDISSVNAGLLPTSNPGPNKLWRDTSTTPNLVKVGY